MRHIIKQNSDLKSKSIFKNEFFKNRSLYFMILPGLLYLIIFHYIPMYGVVIAFKELDIIAGIVKSPWIGLDNFKALFGSSEFFNVLKNSMLISFYRLVWGFPVPITIALILNEISNIKFKRITQTIIYLPHFISWVVIAGLVSQFLSPDGGAVNYIMTKLGGQPIAFLQKPEYFRSIIVASDIWKEAGWGTIIYIAAMSGISKELYEAATIDGAKRFQKIIYITLPSIVTTIIVLLILRTGNILRNGFEQIFLLYNPLVYNVSDVFETYTYRIGLQEGNYSYASAIGIFQSLVGFVLIYLSNRCAKKIGGEGLW